MIHVIASIKVREGRTRDFIDIFKKNVPRVLAEEGCVEYTPAMDLDAETPVQDLDGNRVMVIEKWESLEALTRHFAAPHMAEYKDNTRDMVEHVSIKILQEVI